MRPIDFELYDDEGYPTAEALNYLETFQGTPAQLIDFAESLYDNGFARVKDTHEAVYGDRKRVELVTGGWSGAETVNAVLKRTLFHFGFWESHSRGGLTVYDVPADRWDVSAYWGNMDLKTDRPKDVNRELHMKVTVLEGDVTEVSVPVSEMAHVPAGMIEHYVRLSPETFNGDAILYKGVRYTRTQHTPETVDGRLVFRWVNSDGSAVEQVRFHAHNGIVVDGRFWEKVND